MIDYIIIQIPRLTECPSRCRSTFNKLALPSASGKFMPVYFHCRRSFSFSFRCKRGGDYNFPGTGLVGTKKKSTKNHMMFAEVGRKNCKCSNAHEFICYLCFCSGTFIIFLRVFGIISLLLAGQLHIVFFNNMLRS